MVKDFVGNVAIYKRKLFTTWVLIKEYPKSKNPIQICMNKSAYESEKLFDNLLDPHMNFI
jgi:hypothetical protein